ncbi:hypothetical protein H4R23_000840, partial [Coemansia sp. Cherry 401B]
QKDDRPDAASDSGGTSGSSFDMLWGRDPNNLTLLNDLLETMGNSPHTATSVASEITGITTETVLQGLRSLDEFEQQAAVHSDRGLETGFNEAELSAALEQIYWNSLDVGVVDPADISVSTNAHSPVLDAPTPAPTPVVAEPHIAGDEAEESDDDGNPLELEELSLFSLFLSDMKAFEGFLQNLSLNQLRQCAATVNRVLVQRESLSSGSPPAASTSAQAYEVQKSPEAAEPSGAANSAGVDGLPDSTLSLLREWLPPSTADCVITALQAANLPLPTAKPDSADPTTRPAALPATHSTREPSQSDLGPHDPIMETDVEGIPWLSFVYAQKGKPRRHRIRIDIERAPHSAIPASFQQNNCVYPRAHCGRQAYTGNRWSYETECNKLGWKLAFLNQELLTARRGLLQTAVNNYRTTVSGRKSRRITRLEKAERTQGQKRELLDADDQEGKRAKTEDMLLTPPPTAAEADGLNDGERTASTLAGTSMGSPQTAKCLLINAYVNNKFSRIRIYIDLGTVSASSVDSRFKHEHAVFPRALNTPRSRYSALRGRWEFELTCNELAWRMAWLNKSRLRGRKPLIQKCLDAYRSRFSAPPWALLACYGEQMGGAVDPRFFDYWRPRAGRRRLDGAETAECPEDVLVQSAVPVPANGLAGRAGGAVQPSKPAPPKSATESGSESGVEASAARMRTIRPRSLPATPTSQGVRPQPAAAAPRPTPSSRPRPLEPAPARPPVRPMMPANRPRPANGGPPRAPRPASAPGNRPQRPAAGVSKPAQFPMRSANRPARPVNQAGGRPPPPLNLRAAARPPTMRPASARPPQSQPPPPQSQPPQSQPPSSQPTPSSAQPAASRPSTAGANSAARSPPGKQAAGGRSARAQVAANMLTDVLRQLAKGDPALASIPGVLEQAAASADDSTPLDAKVAELEKLIIDLQRP